MTIREIFNLASERQRGGDVGEAEKLYRQILVQVPTHSETRINLGTLLHDARRFADAVLVYRLGLAMDSASAVLWSNMSNTLCEMGEWTQAASAGRRAVEINPDSATAHNNLGNALRRMKDLDRAAAHYERAIALRPEMAMAHNNLGAILYSRGEFESAAECSGRAVELSPEYAEGHNNLGNIVTELGQWEKGLEHCRKSLALRPQHATAHWNLGLMLLRQGDFENGWPEYEWRSRVAHLIEPRFEFPQPQWRGEALQGRRILLHAEQGFGDAIQFVRYAQLVTQRGGHVSVYVPPELVRLFSGMEGVERVVAWSAAGEGIGEIDLHCPLLSLPSVFKTTLATIPANVPYLFAEKKLGTKWRECLGDKTVRNVGLVWAGRPTHYNDRARSISLSALAPLAGATGVRLISLQKNASPAAESPVPLTDWTSELDDFAETAGLIENLDLVIAADTAVAHLAGAMGKPVWVFVPYVPDFRWMLNRDDSPWYPTMRLFRQERLGDWSRPITRVADELRAL